MGFFHMLTGGLLPPSPVQHNGLPNMPGVPGFNAGFSGIPGMSTGGNNPGHAQISPIMQSGGFDPASHYNRLANLMYGGGGFNQMGGGTMGGFGQRLERF